MASPNPVPDYSRTVNAGLHHGLEIIDRIYAEAYDARQSLNGNTVWPKDVDRIKEGFTELRAWVAYWNARDVPDQPMFSGVPYMLPDMTPPVNEGQAPHAQNALWQQALQKLYAFREEFRMAPSRNDSRGFTPRDMERWQNIMADIENYFDNFVFQIQPPDSPQTTSNVDLTLGDQLTDQSPGKTGPVYPRPGNQNR